jgi:hypothetical protein
MGILHIGIANGGYINVCEYVHVKWKYLLCTVMLVFGNGSLTTLWAC